MSKFLIQFKEVVRFLVSVIASREFAFIYCVFGTIAQTAHTYYLINGISSLSGWWGITQSVLLSFFISSSLLYFTAISDSNDRSLSGQRVLKAVTLFMWLEIIINLYYYSKHIVIETNNYDTANLFQLAFGAMIAVIIPVTIKLYSSQIRAKEWLTDTDEKKTSTEQLKQITEIEEKLVTIQKDIDSKIEEKINSLPEPTIVEQPAIDVEEIKATLKEEILSSIPQQNSSIEEHLETVNHRIEEMFNKQSDLFLKQFQNKLKMAQNSNK